MVDPFSFPTRPILPASVTSDQPLTTQQLQQEVDQNPEPWIQYITSSHSYIEAIENVAREWEKHSNACDEQLNAITTLMGGDPATQFTALNQRNEDLKLAVSSRQQDKRSATHPDPEKFDGTRDKLRPFLVQLRLKLAINEDHFPTEEKKVIYALSRLTGIAIEQVLPMMTEDSLGFDSIPSLIRYLEASFADPDRQKTAQHNLHTLRQKNRDFTEFIAEFNRYAPDTGFDEIAKISCLEIAICDELRKLMINHDTPKILLEYISLLQSLWKKWQIYQNSQSRRSSKSTLSPQSQFGSFLSKSFSTPSTRSTVPTPSSISLSVSFSDSVSNLGPIPMDLSNARRGQISWQEKMRRKSLGLYTYYREAGHQIRNCPSFKCYNCGNNGHGVNHCPFSRKTRAQEIVSTVIGRSSSHESLQQETQLSTESKN